MKIQENKNTINTIKNSNFHFTSLKSLIIVFSWLACALLKQVILPIKIERIASEFINSKIMEKYQFNE